MASVVCCSLCTVRDMPHCFLLINHFQVGLSWIGWCHREKSLCFEGREPVQDEPEEGTGEGTGASGQADPQVKSIDAPMKVHVLPGGLDGTIYGVQID